MQMRLYDAGVLGNLGIDIVYVFPGKPGIHYYDTGVGTKVRGKYARFG